MTYQVFRNREGHCFEAKEFDTLDQALSYAAQLCGVTKRTMRHRYKTRASSGGETELSGRETGRDGVWLREAIERN